MTGPTPQQLAQSGSLEELSGFRIRMGAGGRRRAVAVGGAEKTFEPYRWSYAQAKGALDAAGRLINTELAKRRNLVLHNPAASYAPRAPSSRPIR